MALPALQLVEPQHAPSLSDALPGGVWRGSELASGETSCVSSGWDALDFELPGGGWPAGNVVELLYTQPATVEFRITGPALKSLVAQDRQVVLVGPPIIPHLPGLLHEGLCPKHLVWIQASTPAERLWTTEQVIKSGSAGAVLAWLPQARPDQLRRLQAHSQACEGLVFLYRPEAVQHDSSPSPLRLLVTQGDDWTLGVSVFKRRGSTHVGPLRLPSVPGGLASILTPALRASSRPQKRAHDVVDRPTPTLASVN